MLRQRMNPFKKKKKKKWGGGGGGGGGGLEYSLIQVICKMTNPTANFNSIS